NSTNYSYDGFSRLMSSTDAGSNQTRYTYTPRGYKLTSSDPDLGAWVYTYDGIGEMLTQTDAKTQLTQLHYDALGRMDKRWDPGAASRDGFWNWDTPTNGIGRVGSMTGPSGYSETYSYDGTAGRKTQDAVAANGATYYVNYGYDPLLGKLQTITYPTSSWPSGSQRFEVFYDYQ